MKRCVWCLILALFFALTACGGGKEEDNRSQASSVSERMAGIEEMEILLTVDGRRVPAWRYFYWLEQTCDAIREDYLAAGLELDWNAAAGDRTLGEYAKAQALSDTLLYATVENWADLYDCHAEEEAPATFEANLMTEGLRPEQAAELNAVGAAYGRLYDLFCTEGSVLYPSPEALASHVEETGWMSMDYIFIPMEENRNTAEEKAAVLFSRLNTAGDQDAEFEAMMAEAQGNAGQKSFRAGRGAVEQTLEETLKNLREGQFSGILETESGFALLKKRAVPKNVLMESFFDQMLQDAVETAKVQCGNAYLSLHVETFCQDLWG